jgi:hypothetical protein
MPFILVHHQVQPPLLLGALSGTAWQSTSLLPPGTQAASLADTREIINHHVDMDLVLPLVEEVV